MSIEVPDNARGPILDLTLPASEDAIDIVLRNVTTGKQLTLNLPAGWEGEDLSLDWRLRTITGATGVDRSALLDPEDNELWAAAEPFSGTVDVEVEALGAVVSTGVLSPGTMEDYAGTGSHVWSKPANAGLEDGALATVGPIELSGESHYLKATNFNPGLSAGSTVVGVAPSVKRRRSTGGTIYTCYDRHIQLVKAGEVTGEDKASNALWPEALDLRTYGGAADLWGLTLGVADVNSSNFGFVLAAWSSGATGFYGGVDYMPLEIYYRPPAAPYAATAGLRWEKGYY